MFENILSDFSSQRQKAKGYGAGRVKLRSLALSSACIFIASAGLASAQAPIVNAATNALNSPLLGAAANSIFRPAPNVGQVAGQVVNAVQQILPGQPGQPVQGLPGNVQFQQIQPPAGIVQQGGIPQQAFPQPGLPPQGLPPQGLPQGFPQQGFPQQGFAQPIVANAQPIAQPVFAGGAPQPFPQPTNQLGFANNLVPANVPVEPGGFGAGGPPPYPQGQLSQASAQQGLPPQGFPQQGFPPPGFAQQGAPLGAPPGWPNSPQGGGSFDPYGFTQAAFQGAPQGAPQGAGQQFSFQQQAFGQQGLPPQGFPQQGFPPHGFPQQGFPQQGFQGGPQFAPQQQPQTASLSPLPPQQMVQRPPQRPQGPQGPMSRDPQTGCGYEMPREIAGLPAEWTGRCTLNGLAHGTGVLRVLAPDDQRYLGSFYGIYKDGRPIYGALEGDSDQWIAKRWDTQSQGMRGNPQESNLAFAYAAQAASEAVSHFNRARRAPEANYYYKMFGVIVGNLR